MGTQQILMIVLSVIVVGAAITIGIQMFDTQYQNQVKNALVQDLQRMGVEAQAWYRTPIMAGGGGNYLDRQQAGSDSAPVPTDILVKILQYVDRNANTSTSSNQIHNENGDFTFSWTEPVLTITGLRYIQGSRIECQANVTLNRGYDGININPVVTASP